MGKKEKYLFFLGGSNKSFFFAYRSFIHFYPCDKYISLFFLLSVKSFQYKIILDHHVSCGVDEKGYEEGEREQNRERKREVCLSCEYWSAKNWHILIILSVSSYSRLKQIWFPLTHTYKHPENEEFFIDCRIFFLFSSQNFPLLERKKIFTLEIIFLHFYP